MNWSFRAFALAGIAVRIHWTLPLCALLVAATHVARFGFGSEWLVYLGVLLGFSFLFVLLHELGHCWAARRLGLGANEILLWPLGGLATVGSSGAPWAEVAVAAAGPAVNAAICAACAVGMSLHGDPWEWTHLDPLQPYFTGRLLPDLFRASWAQLAFNLFLPAFPLDGGRILQGLLAVRLGFERATLALTSIAMGVAAILVLGGLLARHLLLALIGAVLFIQSLGIRRLVREGGPDAIPLFGGSDAGGGWSPPDAGVPRPHRRRPGFFERLRQERAARRARRLQEEEARLRVRVDQLLDKVSRGGLASLSPDERRFLEQASRRFQEFAARRDD